jgi:hypothetical protein
MCCGRWKGIADASHKVGWMQRRVQSTADLSAATCPLMSPRTVEPKEQGGSPSRGHHPR